MIKKKILVVGQLPKELGGNYSTGVANVVKSLYSFKSDCHSIFIYSTNLTTTKASQLNKDKPVSNHKYYGYKVWSLDFLTIFFFNGFSLIKNIWLWHFVYKISVLRNLFYYLNIHKVIKEIRPDLIHIHGIYSVPCIYSIVGDKIPILLTFHGIFMESNMKLYINASKKLRFVSYLTQDMKGIGDTRLSLSRALSRVIPNGVNSESFYYSEKDRQHIRNDMGVSDQENVFITVASLQERKGQLRMLKKLVKSEIRNWRYWLIGQGIDKEEILMFIKNNELETKVKVFGYIDHSELYKYYSAADIYIHPSSAEGQALSAIEAFNTNLPILVNKDIKATLGKTDNIEVPIIEFDFDEDFNIDFTKIAENERSNPTTFNDWKEIYLQYTKFYDVILTTTK